MEGKDEEDGSNKTRQNMLFEAISQVYSKPKLHKETDHKNFYKENSKELLELLKELLRK